MLRVFISHSSRDRQLVEQEIVFPLRTHGLETWYSTENIKSASEWERQISDGLKACDWFLVVLSPRSVASEWVRREVHWAFIKRQDRIVPVMLETCDPEDLHLGLLPIQYLDFRNDLPAAQEQLLSIWGLDKSTQVKTELKTAEDLLTREDWVAAIEHLETVLKLDPAHSQARADLNYASQRQELSSTYETAAAHLREKRWSKALDLEQLVKEEVERQRRAKTEIRSKSWEEQAETGWRQNATETGERTSIKVLLARYPFVLVVGGVLLLILAITLLWR